MLKTRNSLELTHSSEREIKHRRSQSFNTRNIGIILVEIFPVQNEDSMLNGLKSLLERDESPRIQKMEGVLGAGWSLDLGYLTRVKMTPGNVIKKDLPTPFEGVEVRAGQRFDFCYYLTFTCYIDPKFQGGIVEKYVSTTPTLSTWDDTEPSIREYQQKIEAYLSQYVRGVFLSQQTGKIRCPSIRILLTDSIDFNDFEKWLSAHYPFLRFLGFRGACSRYGPFLIGYQPDRLFKPEGIFAGLTFLASEPHHKLVTSRLDRELVDSVYSYFERTSLLPFFIAIYWAVNNIENTVTLWEKKLSPLEARLKEAIVESSLGSVKSVYEEMAGLRRNFETSVFDEEGRISTMRRTLPRLQRPESDPLPVFGLRLDVCGDIAEGIRFVDEERDRLAFVRRRIATNFEQAKQFTDFQLQSSMQKLTIVAAVLGAIALLVALLPSLSSALAWVASHCV